MSAIILDDHLVHTDPSRLKWFRKALREPAAKTQVIVLTCRPHDSWTSTSFLRRARVATSRAAP